VDSIQWRHLSCSIGWASKGLGAENKGLGVVGLDLALTAGQAWPPAPVTTSQAVSQPAGKILITGTVNPISFEEY
jgi:hypothetical protein